MGLKMGVEFDRGQELALRWHFERLNKQGSGRAPQVWRAERRTWMVDQGAECLWTWWPTINLMQGPGGNSLL